jgi:phosphoribosylaminoimidazole carboxylase (NCAIR synthetase)
MDNARPAVLHVGWWNDIAASLAHHQCDATFVVAAADADAPARHGFTGRVVIVPDPERIDDVVAGLRRASIDVHEFDVVCTEFEANLVPTAVLAAAYQRSGLPVATAVALRDKAVQKRLVRDAGLPVAGSRTVTTVAELDELAPPFVVKPLAGVSTQLTFVVRDTESLASATTTIARSGQHGPWLVEEFMAGRELHIDGVVRHGTVLFHGVSRYIQNVIEIQSGGLVGSVTVDPGTSAGLHDRAGELVSLALKALEHTDGVFHLEAFEQGDRLVFSECAGRIGGGMVLETTRNKFRVDLYDEWTRSVLGKPSGLSEDRRAHPDPFGWIQLIGRPGRVISMPSWEDVRNRPGVVAVEPNLKSGDTIPDPKLASNFRAARLVMTGQTEEGLAQDMREIVDWYANAVEVE